MGSDSKVRLDYNRSLVIREKLGSGEVIDQVHIPGTSCGCALEEVTESTSGDWIVGMRCSGQGEWGYDVIKGAPLRRVSGIEERNGYMLDMPEFAEDESFIVGGYGENWLGGWWAHPDDDFYETPSRGGRHDFGWLFRHYLPSQEVEWMHLSMDLPSGWFPDDPEDEKWLGARLIEPSGNGVTLVLPGGTVHTISEWSAEATVPAPTPDGRGLL